MAISLDDVAAIKECENDFEKFYFVSMVSTLRINISYSII